MQQQISMYEDGNRLVVVFENANTNIKQMIGQMMVASGNTQGVKKVPDVAPPVYENRPMPVPAPRAMQIPEINENVLIQEQGFAGFCQVYSYYREYAKQLPAARRQQLMQVIGTYSNYYKTRNVEEIPDEELISLLRTGSETLFPKDIRRCLQQSGYISLDDFLASGRNNLVDAYLTCFHCA